MSPAAYSPMRLRTQYSMLEAACKIKPLMARAAELEFPAVALTDKGNLFGAIEFYQAAQCAGIKPLIGVELHIHASKKESGPLLLYARNETGYINLLKLVTLAHLEHEYTPKGITGKELAAHAEGIAALSGNTTGLIAQALLKGDTARAEKWVTRLQELFGPEAFFLEIQNHGTEEESKIHAALIELSQKTSAPLIATNEVIYVGQEHAETYDILSCIRENQRYDDPTRDRLLSNDYYLKSGKEMVELFKDCPEAITNIQQLIDICNLELEFNVNKYPSYPVEDGVTREGYLRELCEAGLKDRYGDRAGTDPELKERLDYELGIIETMGFVSYFLIVWDFIDYAKRNDIPVGPGRGSGAGSMVAYVLRITDLDPIRYGLIFERFLNPERHSPPDIDVDFCQDRRGEVIRYVREKYGKRSVAQIVTYGTMGAKMAIRDVARVLGLSFGEASRIADFIPKDPGSTISKAMAANPEFKQVYEEEEVAHECIDYALNLEGMVRQTGTHAAGVVIAEGDLTQYLPLTQDDHDNVITQYSMGMLESVGMLKMDFLGLKTLTVIQDSLNLLKSSQGIDLLAEDIPLEDDKTFELLNRGQNVGVFQVESPGMRKLCRQFDVTTIDDIIALIALYRPGPMELIPDYIACKKGEREIEYDHPLLEEVSSDTYGFMIYQEQVMKAAQLLAGYSLGDADLFRRAMGKKKKEVMDEQRERFVSGCAKLNNIPKAQAEKIFALLEKFAGYGFNKSHSAAYGLISYQTAYLKANYPVPFMAGLMSNDLDNTDKIALFIGESREMDIEVLPPCVNHSLLKFSIEDMRIRYGFAAIKGVGQAAAEAIVVAREEGGPFVSMADFCQRVEFRAMNKKTVEALVRCGAFNSISTNRAGLFEQIDKCMAQAGSVARDLASGQGMFFLDEDPADQADVAQKEVDAIPPWSKKQNLDAEKELLGVYFSGHPIDECEEDLRAFRTLNTVELSEVPDRTPVRLAGLLMSKEVRIAQKSQKPYARLNLEDRTGAFEIMVWPEMYQEVGENLVLGQPIIVEGAIDRSREDQLRLNPHKIYLLEDAYPSQIREVYVLAKREDCSNGLFPKLKGLVN
ncbi:MAG: DNA polymerase III subunit alpha, partial [Verrucomicrobiota bacterium]